MSPLTLALKERLVAHLDQPTRDALEFLNPNIQDATPEAFFQALSQFSADVTKGMAIDAVQKANSGHPGGPCSSVDFAWVLFSRALKASHDPSWIDRDRFILSGGHMSMLLYALLYFQGHLTHKDLEDFRQLGSRTQGHPVFRFAPGIESTTGPLGQGFANGVGMAVAERYLRGSLGSDVIDHKIYVLATDGDIEEGLSREAASLAGHLGLDHLIVFYDANDIQLASPVADTMTEDVAAAFRAMHWNVIELKDGHDHPAIEMALVQAQSIVGTPTIIIGKTQIARGTEMEGTVESHGSPLGAEVIRKYKESRHHPTDSVIWAPPIVKEWISSRLDAGDAAQKEWTSRVEAARGAGGERSRLMGASFCPERAAMLMDSARAALRELSFKEGSSVATRSTGGQAMAALAQALPHMFGGSADLSNSTKTDVFEKAVGIFPTDVAEGTSRGRGLMYGVREHAMGSMTNGVALHGGLRPYSGTFLAFSDYMRPAIRLAAISHLPSVFIFTHDSIFLGEDGETHQPVEQVEALRLIPGVLVMRPGDAHETAACWEMIAAEEFRDLPRPICLVLTRQNVPVLPGGISRYEGTLKGGYVVRKETSDRPQLQIVATGSEVHLAVDVATELVKTGVDARVISIPCQKVFLEQDETYRHEVLLPGPCPTLGIEAGVGKGWASLLGSHAEIVSIERFGQSAPADQLASAYGFTTPAIVERARGYLSGYKTRMGSWIEDAKTYV